MTRFQFASPALAALMAAAVSACNQTALVKPAADTAKVADAVKADVAQLVVDLNAHDSAKAAGHDAPDVVGIFHGAPNVVGPAADEASNKQAAGDPNWHVTLVDQAVDVPASGDMAVYRSTYDNTFTDAKTKKPTTLRVNYLAGYKKQADGSWKIAWYVVSDTGPAPAAATAATS